MNNSIDYATRYSSYSLPENLPKDLYIDPNALLVFLELFEGPLDLLLYLIRKQNLDILNIPIAEITNQYMSYIDAMQILNINLAAEYLSMAATLITIKTKLMLPILIVDETDTEIDADPRAALINQLIEYEKIKYASDMLDKREIANRDYLWVNTEITICHTHPQPNINDLKRLWQKIFLKTVAPKMIYNTQYKYMSIDECIENILQKLSPANPQNRFSNLLMSNYTISILVAYFVALLELGKRGVVELYTYDDIDNDIIIRLRGVDGE